MALKLSSSGATTSLRVSPVRMALSLTPLNPDLYPPGAFQIPGGAVSFLVGREDGNDLRVDHSSVSARHARLETGDSGLLDVVDCGSTNGTFVNGIRVDRKQLSPGDLLRFATAEFRVTSEGADTPEHGSYLNGSAGLNGATHAVKLSHLLAEAPQQNPIEQERDQLRFEVEKLSARISELEAEDLQKQSCLTAWGEEITTLYGHLATRDEAFEKQGAAHQAEVSGLNRTIQEQERVRDSIVTGHAVERNALSLKLEEREKAFASLSEESSREINRLTGALSELDAEQKALTKRSGDEIRILGDRLKESEEKIRVLERNLDERNATIKDITTKRESEVASLSGKLAAEEESSLRLKRDLDAYGQREERNLAQISETRKELMDRESRIAALHYEVTARDGNLLLLGNQRQQLQQENDLLLAQIAGLQDSLEVERRHLAAALEARQEAEAKSEDILKRLKELGDRLSVDWISWFREDGIASDFRDAGATFSRLDFLAGRIRGELDLIEPVWQRFGDHVQEELASRCGAFRKEEAELVSEILDHQSQLVSLKADLEQVRELVDNEVRRAQGLSRRGTELEIPERFEAMVIARDREQEIYRHLIDRLEVIDRLLEEYRGSRKLRQVSSELSDFRVKLAEILSSGGVEEFQVELGTFLSLKHRREVQILSRKGWGTTQYSEYPFQPGEVTKVVRPGYRAGNGENAVIIRKVEVLIRGIEG